MAGRLEFHWIPFVKYSLVLSVYIFAGGMLVFYLEECRYSSAKETERRKSYVGNITSVCIKLAGKMVSSLNASKAERNSLHVKLFFDQCQRLLDKEEIIHVIDFNKCSWEWKNIRKWIKLVSCTLATIGYPDIHVDSQVGKGFFIVYLCFGVPLSVMCYIHFGRIIRVVIRRCIRRVEAHFFNRTEPRNIRHKVIFYNSIIIVIITIAPSIILKLNGKENWTFVDCLYYYAGVISTSGNGHLSIDSDFFAIHAGLSVLTDAFQILGLGFVSSLIQAGAGLHRAKHRRGRVPIQRHSKNPNEDTRNDVINGTVAMDSLVILVRHDEEQEKFT